MKELRPGYKVKIIEGAFTGLDGIVQTLDQRYITVMIVLFGRETFVQVKPDDLQWEGQDLRPVFQQELTRLLDGQLKEMLNDWWLQRLVYAEDDAAGEYQAFLQFRSHIQTEHAQHTAQLQNAFSAIFTDSWFVQEGDARPRECWSALLGQWGLGKKPDPDLTVLEQQCLKQLGLIDGGLVFDWRAPLYQRWSGAQEPGADLSPRECRSLLRQAAQERYHRAQYLHWRREHMPTSDELMARRVRARQQVEAEREAVQAFFQQSYHLRLPDHVFTFWSFWLGLTAYERSAMNGYLDSPQQEFIHSLGLTPAGFFAYFEKEGRNRPPRAGLDRRLYDRFYCDPPEFLTALAGDTDGLHFGLWYDNPHESSAFVVSYYSRDGGGIGYEGQTLLEAVRKQIEWAALHLNDLDDEERSMCRLSIQLLRDAVMEYETADRSEQGATYIHAYGQPEGRIPTCNGAGVVVPPSYEQLLQRDTEAIYQAICADAPEVEEWVKNALQACERGQPAWALALGHDLHWLSAGGKPQREAAAHLLLTRAYAVLGYEVLAEIAHLHHLHRDLPNVDIYTAYKTVSS